MKKTKQIILTNFKFDAITCKAVDLQKEMFGEHTVFSYLKLVAFKKIDGVFICQPSWRLMMANMIMKIFIRPELYVVYYDLILQRPTTIPGKIIAKLKGFLLNRANYFYFLQKDIAGYIKYYSLNAGKIRFVAFKANKLKFIDKITSEDHGYIFSAGVSHRDYNLTFFCDW